MFRKFFKKKKKSEYSYLENKIGEKIAPTTRSWEACNFKAEFKQSDCYFDLCQETKIMHSEHCHGKVPHYCRLYLLDF